MQLSKAVRQQYVGHKNFVKMNIRSLMIEDATIPIFLYLMGKELILSIKFFSGPHHYFLDHIGVWSPFYKQMMGAWVIQILLIFDFVICILKKPVYRNLNGLFV